MIDINIKSSNNLYDITLSGHANYAPAGKDIVCAAVSVLIETLIAETDGKPFISHFTHETKPDKTRICFEYNPFITETAAVIHCIETGLKGVAQAYPDNVKITKKVFGN